MSSFFYVLLFLPETLKPENRVSGEQANMSVLKIAFKSTKFLKNAFYETKFLSAILTIAFFKAVLDGGVQQLCANYLIKMYNYDTPKLDIFFLVVGVGTIICQSFLLYLALRFCNKTYLFTTTLILQGMHSILYGICGFGEWLAFTAAIMGCLGNMSTSLLTEVVSSTAAAEDQGKIQGTLGISEHIVMRFSKLYTVKPLPMSEHSE